MNFAKHITKSNKRKLSNQQKGQARNYKTKCNCFCRKRQCQTSTNCLANNYKTVRRVKDKSFCSFCNKRRAKNLPTCETCIAQSFSCVNRSFSKLLLRKTAVNRQKFLQFLQQTPCEKIAHLRNLHCAEFCLCKHDIIKTSTAKNSE